MNSDEQRILSEFLEQLVQVKVGSKDADAERAIAAAFDRQPDAGYLLVQKVLLQQQALNAATARIRDLQSQLEQRRSQPAGSGAGFLGNDPWAASSRPSPPAGGWSNPAPSSAFGGMGSFLGTAAATAAGIAGGAFLFQGIESLLGHHGGGFFDQAGSGEHIDHLTINEYYGPDSSSDSYAGGDDDFQQADFDATDDDYGDDSISV